MGSITSINNDLAPAAQAAHTAVLEATELVKSDPSNPMHLAMMQAALGERSVTLNARATIVKALADNCSTILSKT